MASWDGSPQLLHVAKMFLDINLKSEGMIRTHSCCNMAILFAGTAVFFIWAYLPDQVLESVGITYYPRCRFLHFFLFLLPLPESQQSQECLQQLLTMPTFTSDSLAHNVAVSGCCASLA